MRASADSRAAAKGVALGVLVLAASLSPASASAGKGRPPAVAADYSCAAAGAEAEDGRQRVRVVFDGRFPDRGRAGTAVRVGEFTVRPELTGEAVRALLPAGATAVSGTARLAADLALDGRGRTRADWSGLVTARTPLGAEGGAAPSFTGALPELTATRAGHLTLTAGELALTLAVEAPGPEAGAGPLAAAPVELRCAPLRTPGPRLASWEVTAPATTAPPRAPVDASPDPDPTASGAPAAEPPVRAARAPGKAPDCPVEPPEGELDPARLPKPPPGAIEGGIGGSLCTVPVGYATVRKQHAAMIVNDPRRAPGLMHLSLGKRTVSTPDGSYTESDSLGILHLPDADSTFLTFGFQPVSARVTFEPDPVTIVNILRGGRQTTTVGYWQHLRIHRVRLGGVPLDVGPRCRTARKIDTSLSGEYPFLTGGLLTGSITIPPFTGCRTPSGEDLSRLFTAAISGPGNTLRIQQGGLTGGGASPPVPPLPSR
ncbi:DUF6801 domain-containing protein [Streptomyces lichenis]|uniref:DUF6801 domain-containing protein n=1 Tax=Streptomyces lichenis TaxID=2306967 RepID=A0ABT0IH38_9ACTN|nr:DUF6801 domain-containing protein [Streptomyces lichenis]MCK8680645.1 hypothetical protein [Streptomyces lichenis]